VRKKSTESVPASSASWETVSERFESRLLPAFKRRTEEVGRLLPELYLHGLAQGDFDLALRRGTDDLRAGPGSQRPAHGRGHQNDPEGHRSPGGGRMTRPRPIGPHDAIYRNG
jgi:hypothetical protein